MNQVEIYLCISRVVVYSQSGESQLEICVGGFHEMFYFVNQMSVHLKSIVGFHEALYEVYE